jgi:hypothetical protein
MPSADLSALAPAFARSARARLLRLAHGFLVIALAGPRQSGKTTLARSAVPRHAYVSLEELDTRAQASADPRSCCGTCKPKPPP